MDALAKSVRLTPTKLRLAMIALLGIGIFFGTIGVAYAQGEVSAGDVDSKPQRLRSRRRRRARVLHASGIRLSRRGADPVQEHGQLHDQVVPRLLHSVARFLGVSATR